ncbi:Bug family tripartite tricarboxylate transporter substrate binding protein [Pigmentiphaga litoralis]|uniref:Bug family tripartite tricarboxylate transporter substrate binding protein n=1 Tax=Pigmentiphaga litoralis TaxID=516702 RepID=UPI003B437A04
MKKLIAAGVTGLVCVSSAVAADYPTRPVRLLVHFPAGSSTDVIARVLAEKVGAKLGQPIVVENKPGADGAIAAQEVQRAPADGYTLLLATNSPMSGVPVLRKSVPYDPVTDFTPISDVGRYTFMVYVNAGVPVRTLPELVDYARARPGKLSYASGNVTGQLAFAYVALNAKLDMVNVPYKGEPPGIADLVGKRVDVMVATAGTGVPQVQSGRLKALATIIPKRSFVLPEVPTVQESGFPDFSLAPWAGLFGPAKMPVDVVARLNREFADAMKQPDVLQKMAQQEFALTPSTPQALGALVARQLAVHRELANAIGLQAE